MSYLAAFAGYVALCVVVTFMLYYVVMFFEARKGWRLVVIGGILAFVAGIYAEGRVSASHVKHISPPMHRIP